jgi:formamidopyrimidine-DNA glycosylase
MPELPEVEAVVRRFNESAAGATVHSVKIERPGSIAPQQPAQFKSLHGETFLKSRRRAKYIFLCFSNQLTVSVHLRMTGNLYVLPDYNFRPHHTRLWFRLSDNRAIIFEDSRALGRVHLVSDDDVARIESSLGPEPLEPTFTPQVLQQILKASPTPIKPFLMDQARIAGIGNIYASEALWHARIHPSTPANALPQSRQKALHAAIQKVLRHAVNSAYAEYTQPGSVSTSESLDIAAYARAGDPCPRCNTPIERIVQSSRSTFFCPHCQPC